MTALHWVLDHWYLPLLFVGAVVLWLSRRTKQWEENPVERMEREVASIQAKQEARAIKAQLGAEVAREHVRDKYRLTRARLDEELECKARELEEDPVKLAQFLEKVSRR